MMTLPRIIRHMPLLGRIAVAITAGILVGLAPTPMWAARAVATFNAVFSQFLGFMIPLIIVGFVAPAIADIGARAGRLLIATALLAYGATFLAGLLSYFTGVLTFPSLIDGEQSLAAIDGAPDVAPYFNIEITPLMGVMTALVLAFMTGLGMAFLEGDVMRRGFNEFRTIVSRTIDTVIIPLLPLYIFGIFLNMTVVGQVGVILECFLKIIVVIFVLHVVILLLQYAVAGAISGRNPLKMLRQMLPAYFTALGTQSSAATIPVTLRQAISMGINPDIAGFVIPLCATIHMSGSTLKIVACALALMIMHGQAYDTAMFVHFIAMMGITIIAAPGIPGGAIMASLGLLGSILGFDESMLALMIALYIAMDSFGTACNVTGDGALAAIIDRFFAPRSQTSA